MASLRAPVRLGRDFRIAHMGHGAPPIRPTGTPHLNTYTPGVYGEQHWTSIQLPNLSHPRGSYHTVLTG